MAERDPSTGKFLPGNQAAKNRPPKEYANAFTRMVSPADMDKIVAKAKEQALDGQHDARTWILDRIVGKVPQILELRAADAILLRDLLDHFEARGMSAGDVFALMLAQFADEDSEVKRGG